MANIQSIEFPNYEFNKTDNMNKNADDYFKFLATRTEDYNKFLAKVAVLNNKELLSIIDESRSGSMRAVPKEYLEEAINFRKEIAPYLEEFFKSWEMNHVVEEISEIQQQFRKIKRTINDDEEVYGPFNEKDRIFFDAKIKEVNRVLQDLILSELVWVLKS